MNILIIDAQGGGIGKQLIAAIKEEIKNAEITAVGTNTAATAAMLKAGADNGATGENAVRVCCKNADIIAGPIGIIIADAMLGEVTPKMALSVAQSNAKKFLIPFNNCNICVAGVTAKNVSSYVNETVNRIKDIMN